MPRHSWLARLRHDVVKSALWIARDLREAGLAPETADLAQLRRALTDLVDAEGQPATAGELWRRFRAEAPPELGAAALEAFGRALGVAEAAVQTGPPARALAAVLGLEPALAELARDLERRDA